MPIVVRMDNKGGTGKTTRCVNLAVALNARGLTIVLDSNP